MIHAYVGNMGSGKSHTAVEQACAWADKWDKWLVCNFALRLDMLEEYCHRKGYRNLLRKVRRGEVYLDDDFTRMATYERSVLLIDEIGILMNKRDVAQNWNKYSKFFLDLMQTRKTGADLFWMAQHIIQVDREILAVTNRFFHMSSFMDVYKIWSMFDAPGYANFMAKRTLRSRLKHQLKWGVGVFDPFVFKVYDTFYRFDRSVTSDLRDVAAFAGVGNPELETYEQTDEPVIGWHGYPLFDENGHVITKVALRRYRAPERRMIVVPPEWQASAGPSASPSPLSVSDGAGERLGVRGALPMEEPSIAELLLGPAPVEDEPKKKQKRKPRKKSGAADLIIATEAIQVQDQAGMFSTDAAFA